MALLAAALLKPRWGNGFKHFKACEAFECPIARTAYGIWHTHRTHKTGNRSGHATKPDAAFSHPSRFKDSRWSSSYTSKHCSKEATASHAAPRDGDLTLLRRAPRIKTRIAEIVSGQARPPFLSLPMHLPSFTALRPSVDGDMPVTARNLSTSASKDEISSLMASRYMGYIPPVNGKSLT